MRFTLPTIINALKRTWFHSVRRQVVLTFALAFTLLTAGFLNYLISEQRSFFTTRSSEQAKQLAATLAANSVSWVLANDVAGLQEILHSAADYPDLRFAMVLSPTGEVLAHNDPAVIGRFVSDSRSKSLLRAPATTQILGQSDDLIDIATPILVNHKLIGWVRIGLSHASYSANLHSMGLHGALYLLLAVSLGVLLALWVARRLTGGLYKLMRLTRQIRAGQHEARIHMKYDDEIATLGGDFNDMLDTLEESEEKFRKVGLYAQDAIIIVDQHGVITDWNRAAEAMFGYAPAEILGHDLHQLLAPMDAHSAAIAVLDQFSATSVGPIPGKTLEFSGLRRNGEIFPVEISISSVKLHDQWHAIGIARDITARKQTEAMRRELAAIVETSREAIFGKNLEGIITSWNEGAERIYGYSANEMIGCPVSRLAPPGRLEEGRQLIRKVQQGAVVENFEAERIRKDGQVIHVSLSLSPIFDESGHLSGISTIAHDITERKLAQLALLRSEHRLAEAQRIAHLGHWDWDVVNDTLHWSDEMYSIFGLVPQQFKADYNAFLQAVLTEDRQTVDDSVRNALERRHDYDIDFRILRSDGVIRHVHAQGEVHFAEDGRPLNMLGTVQDVTQQKDTELTLRRLNRALRTISICNEALVHATTEDDLLSQMCNNIVQTGGHLAAWVDLVEHDGNTSSLRRIMLANMAGTEAVPMPCSSTWSDAGTNCCPTAAAAYSGETQIIHDLAHTMTPEEWRSLAQQHGYASTIALPLKTDHAVLGVLTIHSATANAFNADEVRLLDELASDLTFGIMSLRTRSERDIAMEGRHRNLEKLRESLEDAIQAIATTVEMRDPYTAGHQRQVADLAVAIAQEMGLPNEEAHGIHLAAIVHDLGKISVPAEILSKPGALSKFEYGLIQTHPQVGYDILKNIDFPWPIAAIVLQHHERIDGSGYPQGLKNEEITLGARIIAVADTVEAMASHRPYRAGKGIPLALAEIEQGSGIRYDPAVVSACLTLFREKHYAFDNPSTQRV